MATEDMAPSYKLRFPSNGWEESKYLQFTEVGALLIETEFLSCSWREHYTWIEPSDVAKFLDSIGEQNLQPEFVNGEATKETKALLHRIMDQFKSQAALKRWWKEHGIEVRWFQSSD